MIDRGVVYAVTQSDLYLEAALLSAMALRQLEPDLPITIFSDRAQLMSLPLAEYQIMSFGISSLPVRGPYASRWLKTHLDQLTPYDETLFLDADILPLQPIASLWDYLKEADVAMAADRLPTVAMCDHVAPEEKSYTLGRSPYNATQYNSGVLLWRQNKATRALFEQWYLEWQRFQQQDQLALVRALQTTGTDVALLPKTYNISPRDATPFLAAGEAVHLLHCWGGQVSSGAFRRLAEDYYPEVAHSELIRSLRQRDEAEAFLESAR